MGKRHYIIPVFIPHNGCPNDCVFCNQRRITGQEDVYDFKKIENEIEKAIKTIDFSIDPIVEIAFYGGSFTGIDESIQKKLLKIGYQFMRDYGLDGLRVSTRPDYISHEILSMLEKFGVKRIELGVQSLNEEVLEQSNRGHDVKVVEKSIKLIREYDFMCGIQLMIGLPGDSEKTAIESAKLASQLKPDFVRIYPTLVIKDTELENQYHFNQYKPLDLEEAINISMEMYTIFLKNNIPVIRMGLQPTKNILEGEDVIAGPFHSSFRELVMSRYLLKEICKVLDDADEFSNLQFEVNPKDISYLIGNKGVNKKYLITKYHIPKIKIVENKEINRGSMYLHVNKKRKAIRFS